MVGHNHYVPILKGRDGEYGALQTLDSSVRANLTPLLEIPPIDWDYIEQKPKKTIGQHLGKVGEKIGRAWGNREPLFVDLRYIPDGELMSTGDHPLRYVFQSLRQSAVEAIPVVGLCSTQKYLETCNEIVRQDDRGVCVRIQREDLLDSDDLGGAVSDILNTVGARVQNSDLVLDLGALTPARRYVTADQAIRLIDRLPNIHQWRTFTVASTSFPKNLAGLPQSGFTRVNRNEWMIWKEIVQGGKRLRRRPLFGDYAIAHTEPPEVDPRKMRTSASIRYTCETAWLVLKGRSLIRYGYEQFHGLCGDLTERSEYSGSALSWGDKYIQECAAQLVSNGNLTTWRKVGTSHHLAFVVRQLANEVGS